jgi:hypothetical protein
LSGSLRQGPFSKRKEGKAMAWGSYEQDDDDEVGAEDEAEFLDTFRKGLGQLSVSLARNITGLHPGRDEAFEKLTAMVQRCVQIVDEADD